MRLKQQAGPCGLLRLLYPKSLRKILNREWQSVLFVCLFVLFLGSVQLECRKSIQRKERDFLNGPLVKTPCFHGTQNGPVLGQGNQDPACSMAWPKNRKKTRQKQGRRVTEGKPAKAMTFLPTRDDVSILFTHFF